MTLTKVVVIDTHTSAIGLAAHARQKFQQAAIVAAADFKTPYHLIQFVKALDPQVVFFAWRGALASILQTSLLSNLFVSSFPNTLIGILIPDVIGLDSERLRTETETLRFVDFYLVTSDQLREAYSRRFPDLFPPDLYRDLPDFELISNVKNETEKGISSDLIWVGNSKWGINQGLVDHKGFKQLLLPLLRQLGQGTVVDIIDSGEEAIPHKEVLRRIKNAKILLQTSKSEGTGLPLLEAAGLGRVAVTTDVGIAREFLLGPLEGLIVDRSVEGFLAGISYASKHYEQLSDLMLQRFDVYISEVSRDRIPLSLPVRAKVASRLNSRSAIIDYAKWFLRWVRSRE